MSPCDHRLHIGHTLGRAGLIGLSHPQKVVSTSPATFDSYLRFKSLFCKPLDIMKDPSSQRLKTHCFSMQLICSRDTRSKHSSLFRLVSKVHLSGSTFIFFFLSLAWKAFSTGKIAASFCSHCIDPRWRKLQVQMPHESLCSLFPRVSVAGRQWLDVWLWVELLQQMAKLEGSSSVAVQRETWAKRDAQT